MAEGQTINIKLIKEEGNDGTFKPEPSVPEFAPTTQESESGGIASGIAGGFAVGGGNIGGQIYSYAMRVLPKIGPMAIAKFAYDAFKKQRSIVMEDRGRTETLRNYGGANFVANSFGDTFDIFGARRVGESVAYKR